MNKRKDYIQKCIESSLFLSIGSKDETQRDYILSRANDMINDIWKFEYKSYSKEDKVRNLQISQFWGNLGDELFFQKRVSQFKAVWDETINPPSNENNLHLYVQPNQCITYVIFKLKNI